MSDETVHSLSDYAYKVFDEKGITNSVKVRRVMQIAKDLFGNDLSGARILDLGCAEGLYSIEAALRGAKVLAIDGRDERMDWGRSIARELSFTDIEFLRADVRRLSRHEHGEFDIILFLGLLYHLDAPALFEVVSTVYEMCLGFVIMDTQISLESTCELSYRGVTYRGRMSRKHGDDDPPEVIHARLAGSLDNVWSFKLTRESLLDLLYNVGFTTVFECHMPPQLNERNRITLAAIKGSKVKISAYPWINDRTEQEITARLRAAGPWRNPWWTPFEDTEHGGWKASLRRLARLSLRKLGYELKKLPK